MMRWKRGAASTRKWSANGRVERLMSRSGQICITFTMPAGGGGTDIEVIIESDEFAHLVHTMAAADARATLAAFQRVVKDAPIERTNVTMITQSGATTLQPIAGAPAGAPIPPFPPFPR